MNCIYCQDCKADTRDHVPPKLLLRKPYPNDLITVPVCQSCNSALSADEEYFRVSVIGLLCHTEEANQLFSGPITRAMNRRPSLEEMMFSQLETSGDAVAVNFSYERIGRVINKIARGLEYAISDRLIDSSKVLYWIMREVCEGSSDRRFAPDFSFCIDVDYWEFTFYDSLRITVSEKPAILIGEESCQ